MVAVLSRRLFLAVGGSALSALAFTKPRRRPLVGDWSPTAAWQPTDPWGAH